LIALIDDLGAEPGGNTPEAYARQIVAEVEKSKKVVAASNGRLRTERHRA
jgi:hypothetical protein